VVNVTDRADVAMRLRAFKFFLGHRLVFLSLHKVTLKNRYPSR
jgi:hypothetical protein